MNIKEIQQALISQGYFSEEQVQQPAKLKAAKLNKADRKKDYYSLNRYLSNSAMGQMQTQKKLHNFLEREQEETKALRLGRAYHSAILEPQFFDTDYCIKPNARSKAGKAELEALEQEGKELLSQTEYEAIKD